QLSGEEATGAQLSAFKLMNKFLGLLLDPLAGEHGGGIGPLPFAHEAEQHLYTPEVASAYASVLKAPAAPVYGRWRAWGAACGGTPAARAAPGGVGTHD